MITLKLNRYYGTPNITKSFATFEDEKGNVLMPPPGKVGESIIYVFAQLLLYSATLLGVQLLLQKHNKKER